MFMRIYPVNYQGINEYSLSSMEQIINTTQIVAIKFECISPQMTRPEHREKIEKIFDTAFDNLAVFQIEFSDHTFEYVIGPKNKFDSIK